MTQPTAQFGNYILPRLRAPIDTLVYDELGEAVLRIHNEQFQGTAIADTTPHQKDQPIAYSNVLRSLSYNQILHKLTNGKVQVASPADVLHFWNDILERKIICIYTNSIALFSNEEPNQGLARRVFEILGRKSTKIPLLVAGLGIKKANNSHEFTFTESELTKAIEAPYLTVDENGNRIVHYDPKTRRLAVGKKGIQIWVPGPGEQSGLYSVLFNRSMGMISNIPCMDNISDFDGAKVQVVQVDPKDRAA